MYLLFDIGATKTRLAICKSVETKNFTSLQIFDTSQDFSKGVNLIKNYIENIVRTEHCSVQKIIGGLAGPYPNLPKWDKKKLKKELQKICKQVIIKNDADLAGLVETKFFKNKKAIYLTISTGIGGNFGEPGQIIIDKKNKKTFEDLVSGRGMKEIYKKRPEDIKDKKIWDKQTKLLAQGLNKVIVNTHPDVIILGGGLMNKFVISKIKIELAKIIKDDLCMPKIIKSKYKDLSGIYGALELIR
ncbi:MAG: ROK family protein [Patescibacteria group bacterium]